MTEEDKGINWLRQYTERWTAWAAEWNRAAAAADGDALIRATEEFLRATEEFSNLTRELTGYRPTEGDAEDILRMATAMEEDTRRAFAGFGWRAKGKSLPLQSLIPASRRSRSKCVESGAGHEFQALHRLAPPRGVRRHSFRYFWPGYTPERVRVSWPCIDRFTVTFDDRYEASCDWK